MAEYLIQDTTLSDIADAIRTKTSGSGLIAVADMANLILDITTSSGSGGGTGEISQVATGECLPTVRGVVVQFTCPFKPKMLYMRVGGEIFSSDMYLSLDAVFFENDIALLMYDGNKCDQVVVTSTGAVLKTTDFAISYTENDGLVTAGNIYGTTYFNSNIYYYWLAIG